MTFDLKSPISRPDHQTLTEMTATVISEGICQGKFAPGSQLPSELELIEMLRVSRTTLREALRSLEEQGLIIRRRGLGTFVSERSIVKDLSLNFGITEMITQAGFTPGTLGDVIRQEKASKHVAQNLKIDEGALVIIMDRIRTANNIPIVWSIDIMPSRLLGDSIPDLLDLKKMSLYEYISKTLKLRVLHGVATVRPVAANQEMVHKLHIHLHDPLLLLEQTDFDENDNPMIYSAEYHLPDKITFVIYRKGPHY